jgi:endonuclease/exonuclease/phosphatase family metal-dependent hydrolase
LHTQLEVRPGEAIDLFTTHTDSGSEEIRARQFREIREFIRDHGQGTSILAGDLNVNGDRFSEEYITMMALLGQPSDLWAESVPHRPRPDPGYTVDHQTNTFSHYDDEHRRRLDYILVFDPSPQPPPPALRARE